MKLAIMQPYFLPYLGYFALIKHTNKWIVFDTPQFIRHGWIERNRILKPNEGWQYLKVPLEKHNRDVAIKNVKIRNTENWRQKILAQINHYKKKAPFYRETIDLIEEIFAFETDSISEFDVYALKLICGYLGISFNYSVFSEMDLNIGNINEPDEWALEITKALNGKSYYNLPGGFGFFDKTKYDQNNIDLRFLKLNLVEYDQKRNSFEEGLSIIDVLMFNSVADICLMLDNFELG